MPDINDAVVLHGRQARIHLFCTSSPINHCSQSFVSKIEIKSNREFKNKILDYQFMDFFVLSLSLQFPNHLGWKCSAKVSYFKRIPLQAQIFSCVILSFYLTWGMLTCHSQYKVDLNCGLYQRVMCWSIQAVLNSSTTSLQPSQTVKGFYCYTISALSSMESQHGL